MRRLQYFQCLFLVPALGFAGVPRGPAELAARTVLEKKKAKKNAKNKTGKKAKSKQLPACVKNKRDDKAVNPFIKGAVMPRDLTPHIRPYYTEAARMNGIQGLLLLTVYISDKGKVLHVCQEGKRLGYGLEEAAASAYYRKRFRPATLKGKPVTVKIRVPIRFKLSGPKKR